MADLYIASPSELIAPKAFLAPDVFPDPEDFKKACALIEACNQDCRKAHAVAHRFTPILLPESSKELTWSRPSFRGLKNQFEGLPSKTQEAIGATGVGESFSILEAIRDLKKEWIEPTRSWRKDDDGYGLISLSSDTNTFGGGALGALSHRTDTLVGNMKTIEAMLKKYAKGTGQERQRLRPQIRSAYENLQKKFAPMLERYLARARHKNKSLNRIYSPGRAIRGSQKGHTTPLTARSGALLKVAKHFSMITKGIIALDIGVRANNVYRSDRRWRSAVVETAGFAASFGVGAVGGSMGLALALGPAGWVVLVIGTGVAAVGFDYAGKYLAELTYDQISDWDWLR